MYTFSSSFDKDLFKSKMAAKEEVVQLAVQFKSRNTIFSFISERWNTVDCLYDLSNSDACRQQCLNQSFDSLCLPRK